MWWMGIDLSRGHKKREEKQNYPVLISSVILFRGQKLYVKCEIRFRNGMCAEKSVIRKEILKITP